MSMLQWFIAWLLYVPLALMVAAQLAIPDRGEPDGRDIRNFFFILCWMVAVGWFATWVLA